ncbi:hypothetical protein ACFSR7_05785 [Cohnella sp. GCM10020058]|uniref:hypothetical protein n=1 Tax=Cohnella sp. GCM10020058 TaxID=3317330 RepID=UPI00363E916A
MKEKSIVVIGLLTGKPAIDDYLKNEVVSDKVSIDVRSLKDGDDFTDCDCVVITEMRATAPGRTRAAAMVDKALAAAGKGKHVIWLVSGDEDVQARVASELSDLEFTDLTKIEKADTTHVLDAIIEFSEGFSARPQASAAPKAKAAGASKRRSKTVGKADPTAQDSNEEQQEMAPKEEAPVQPEKAERSTKNERRRKTEFQEDPRYVEELLGLQDPPSPRSRRSSLSRKEEKDANELSTLKAEPKRLPEILENVIAVSGFSGAGVSFVAWNLAACLQDPCVLMEGRTTGALAGWIGRMQEAEFTTREEFLFHDKPGTSHKHFSVVLHADSIISSDEIIELEKQGKTIVIDCGPDFNSDVFRLAKKKVFVAAPDPYYLRMPLPDYEGIIWVLNQWPHGSSFNPGYIEQSFNIRFDLFVDARPRQVMISNWTRRPWIFSEDEEKGMNAWRSVFEREEVYR